MGSKNLAPKTDLEIRTVHGDVQTMPFDLFEEMRRRYFSARDLKQLPEQRIPLGLWEMDFTNPQLNAGKKP